MSVEKTIQLIEYFISLKPELDRSDIDLIKKLEKDLGRKKHKRDFSLINELIQKAILELDKRIKKYEQEYEFYKKKLIAEAMSDGDTDIKEVYKEIKNKLKVEKKAKKNIESYFKSLKENV